ncbi:MAG: methyltransferase domain-containing protein [Patescibacteria group bacterium]|nr:methyltransferase domain-containing protein [Patescibacteria group bacterium]
MDKDTFYNNSDAYFTVLKNEPEEYYREFIKFVMHYLGRGNILDLGCGTGQSSYYLAQAGFDVTGFDLSSRFISYAREKYQDIKFKQGDVEKSGFLDNSFDAVVAYNTLEHFADPEKSLIEMARIVKGGGLVIIQSPNLLSPKLPLSAMKNGGMTFEGKKNFFNLVQMALINTAKLLSKSIFKQGKIEPRKPNYNYSFPDNDANNYANPIDLKVILEKIGMRIILYQKFDYLSDEKSIWQKIMAKLCPSAMGIIRIIAQKNNTAKISACLVVHNEEKYIARCLESIYGAVDEIIVVHDGECADKTLAICKKYTDKIFIRNHAGVAEPHRPFSFRQASGEWILRIDADEFLSAELKEHIKNLVSDNSIGAYEFLWPIWDGKKYLTKQWPRKKCLFRKDQASFLGMPHYVANIHGKVEKCDFILEHRPDYNNLAWTVFKIKWIGLSKIQARIYCKKFSDIQKYNYSGDSWPRIIKLRKRVPLILIPFEFIVTLFNNLVSGAWRGGYAGFLYSLYCAIYRVMVNYYIFLYKRVKN